MTPDTLLILDLIISMVQVERGKRVFSLSKIENDYGIDKEELQGHLEIIQSGFSEGGNEFYFDFEGDDVVVVSDSPFIEGKPFAVSMTIHELCILRIAMKTLFQSRLLDPNTQINFVIDKAMETLSI